MADVSTAPADRLSMDTPLLFRRPRSARAPHRVLIPLIGFAVACYALAPVRGPRASRARSPRRPRRRGASCGRARRVRLRRAHAAVRQRHARARHGVRARARRRARVLGALRAREHVARAAVDRRRARRDERHGGRRDHPDGRAAAARERVRVRGPPPIPPASRSCGRRPRRRARAVSRASTPRAARSCARRARGCRATRWRRSPTTALWLGDNASARTATTSQERPSKRLVRRRR